MESRGIQEECKDVFLSHSSRQKDFVEQLHRDLSTENVSSFLDKDPQSLPKARPFSSRILSNARNCKVAVLVLSPDFVSSKWPMLELSTIVNAYRFTNPDMDILPLFFKISVKTLREKLNSHELLSKWKEFQAEDDRIDCEEWLQALKEILRFNGLEYSEDLGEVAYRDRIVDEIHRLLPVNLKYDDSLVEGNARLCKEVANLFEKAPWRNGVKVVGLYGIAGSGKSTICRSLCNFYSRKFKGKVFHAELQNDLKVCIETQKRALKALTKASDHLLYSVQSKERGSALLRELMPYHKVFVAIDNISDDSLSVEAAQSYMRAGFQEGSMILLTARSRRMLTRLVNEEESSLEHVPLLHDQEAVAVLLKLTHLTPSDLTCAEIEVAKFCTRKCCFGDKFHPLALQAFGAYLFDKFGPLLLQWSEIPDFPDATGSEVDAVISVFELSFRDLSPRHVNIFMLVALILAHKDILLQSAHQWLGLVCNESPTYIGDVINSLKKKGLIEEDDAWGCLRVHDLIRDFAESKTNGMARQWVCSRGVEGAPTFLCGRFCLEVMKFTNCRFQTLPLALYNSEFFANVAVLSLDNVCQLTSLNLSSIKVLKCLVIRNCGELKEIEGIENSTNIIELTMVGCNPLLKAPQIEGLTSLRWFVWGRREKPQLVTQFGDFRKCMCLEIISVQCESLGEYPKLEGLPSLRLISITDCSVVMNAPNRTICSQDQGVTFGIPSVEFIRCPALATGPNLSGHSQLQHVKFDGCSAMITAPDLSGCSQLRIACFRGCSALATGPNLSGLSQLQDVRFDGCSAMITAPDLGGCSQLESAFFSGCAALTTGIDLNGCTQLQNLCLDGCCAMTTGPNISGCSVLQRASLKGCFSMTGGLDVGTCVRLNAVRCEGLKNLGSFQQLTALRHLELIDCVINEAIDIAGCSALEDLTVTECRGLTTFLNFTDLRSLKRFTLRKCKEVADPPNVSNCQHLETVEIRDCSSLTRFPNFAGLSALKQIVLTGCEAVDEPPDVTGCRNLQEIELRDNINMEGVPWMRDCTSLTRLELSWGIAKDRQRSPPQLRECPIFHNHNGRSVMKHFKLYSVRNKYYRFAKIRISQSVLESQAA